MSEESMPATPLPPAAQAPYPAHPAPHKPVPEAPAADATPAVTTPERAPDDADAQIPVGAGIGVMGLSLIGGAVAAVGLAIALPFLWRRKATPAPAKRRRSGKRSKSSK